MGYELDGPKTGVWAGIKHCRVMGYGSYGSTQACGSGVGSAVQRFMGQLKKVYVPELGSANLWVMSHMGQDRRVGWG